MTISDTSRMPCIIGVAQKTWRVDEGDAPEPLEQWAMLAREAARDSGHEQLLSDLDEIDIVFSLSWSYDDAGRQLADKLGLTPRHSKLSGLSGTSPQKFINDAAEAILKGERDLVLVTGAEALATKKRAKKEGRSLPWLKPHNKPAMPFDDPFHPSEVAHQIFQAYLTFAMLDSARRHHHGLSLPHNRQQQAAMMAALSAVAADNPDAWFTKAYTAEQLLETSAQNRMVVYPYSKLQMAFMDVDMASAVVIASDAKADALGIPQHKRIYLHGWAYAREPAVLAERPQLWHSPAIECSSRAALEMAGVDSMQLKHLDLYSCFPASLNFTRDAIEISDDDTRPLTQTGGLPYFGGPGNNYTTHAITAMTKRLRHSQGDYGLVSGVGMHLTNHVFTVYSSQRPESLTVRDPVQLQKQVESFGKKEVEHTATGRAIIAAYSIVYGPDKNTAYAVADLPNGKRCYAVCDDPDMVIKMDKEEWVGKPVLLTTDGRVNRFSGAA